MEPSLHHSAQNASTLPNINALVTSLFHIDLFWSKKFRRPSPDCRTSCALHLSKLHHHRFHRPVEGRAELDAQLGRLGWLVGIVDPGKRVEGTF
jgi:hypothetical protein